MARKIGAPGADIIRKVTIQRAAPAGAEYVMSDETVDRYGDIIAADGWQLTNFKRNPIALFNHDPDFPIGTWAGVRVENGALIGRLELMTPVTDRMREIGAAVDAGVLRAVSVGFRGVQYEPIDGGSGYKFTKSELVECSLVSTPANPNALQIVKSLVSSGKISAVTAKLICGELAEMDRLRDRRGHKGGELADTKTGAGTRIAAAPSVRHTKMNLSEKIERSQDRINGFRAKLEELAASVDDDDEESREAYGRASAEIDRRLESEVAYLDGLKRSERLLGEGSTEVEVERKQPGTALARTPSPKPFPQARGETHPRDCVYRGLAAIVLHHIEGGKRPLHTVVEERYGGDPATHRMTDFLITRASSVPATMTGSSWADTLIQTAIGDFVDALMPASIYPGLSAAGGRFTFGRNGAITLPTRASTPTVGGAFVLDGNAIPVKQASFNGITLVPKKMGVITTFTREIADHSTPAIEGLLRQGIQEDTEVAIDTVLLDATAASTTRPAGLLNGVSSSVKSSLSGFNAIVGDVKMLLGVMTTANALRAPRWIMNPNNVLDLMLNANANGEFPFKAEATAGMLAGYPILKSTTQTNDTVILLDAADFFSATGDAPEFSVSDQAVLHMEDTSPTQIGVSSTAVFPVRSMWQTNSIALRMILPINWAMRRTGVVAFTSGVNW